jgi:hypothetical protein
MWFPQLEKSQEIGENYSEKTVQRKHVLYSPTHYMTLSNNYLTVQKNKILYDVPCYVTISRKISA